MADPTSRRAPWFAIFGFVVATAGSSGPALALDCNGNSLEDACDLGCGAPAGPCDLPGCGSSADCDANGVPDECDLASAGSGCAFPGLLLDNSTGGPDSSFLGAPDDVYWGLGGQIVTYELDCGFVVDGFGPDFTIYEVATGSPEFASLADVLVSVDGTAFVGVKATEAPAVNVPGDEAHGSNTFARSYDLGPSGFAAVRFIRLDGSGTGPGGSATGFDLDALGIVHRLGRDCDSSGTLDDCEALEDCNGNGAPESCELDAGAVADCDANAAPDTCDTAGGTNDCDLDTVPDSCETDCNSNATPDDCDLAAATSADCNVNGVPDECDLAATLVVESSGLLTPVGYPYPRSFTIPAAFPSSGDVTVSIAALGDLEAANEYLAVDVNGAAVGRAFEAAGGSCVETTEPVIVSAEAFNAAVAGGDAVFTLTAPSTVNPSECGGAGYSFTIVSYTPIVDCNSSGTLDACDISGATSTDLNMNGIADDCEPDCNANDVPDDWDIVQGTSVDCNANQAPDECDVAGGVSVDCNANVVPDECEIDCNVNGVPDDCDLAGATSVDCDANGVPDECDLTFGTVGCSFPALLLDNSTGGPDSSFLGAPDDVYWGLGGQIVTFELDCGFVVDRDGPDFTVYEVDTGSPEFASLADVLVSADGATFVSVKGSESPAVRIPGDQQHANDNNARSYDLRAAPLNAARFVRLDGSGTGPGGSGTGFDLDAIGAIHTLGVDCDQSGTLDRCESFPDCNSNALNDACELSSGIDDDCDSNATLDFCDIAGGAADVDDDLIPDSCEPDCNANSVPDHFDIEQGTSTDCNHNVVPDSCDLASQTSADCNADQVPDECPLCPTVEVVFVVDTSSSMGDEGAALCADLTQIVADLEDELVNVNAELLGIVDPGAGAFACLTDSVALRYGTAVPGSPPAGMETLGQPCGANLNEDWGPATAVVAGLKSWEVESVRLIVPVGDEGPRCGNPVLDPGDDRDSINLAIGQAQLHDVIVSPITGTGSSAAVVAMATLLASNTGGTVFSSTDPAQDLSDGVRSIIVGACDSRSDCNANSVPDDCDLAAMTSEDCDSSGRPDECEADCNVNGLHDSCDIAAMTSDDANANMVPDECEGITLTLEATNLLWTPVPGTIGYDVVAGDLPDLRSAAGDFSLATAACMADNHSTTSLAHGAAPAAAGQGSWYLVRAVLGTVQLGYDAFAPGQVAPRDAAITASGLDCP